MFVNDVRNVNEALPKAMSMLSEHGKLVTSRGMETIELPGPMSTVYRNPTERVLFDAKRDANPFFHLMEALWIIAGSNRVGLPKYFMDSIDRFSDDGKTFHGAYGHRLRHAFGYDQLSLAIEELSVKPDSRQIVLSIWDAREDLGTATKDLPCNDLIMLKIRDGKLNMTVCNRSNDAIWGAYGANVVQFSMLQEWLASSIGVDVGHYVQQSDSFHAYTDNPFWQYQDNPDNYAWHTRRPTDPYLIGIKPYPLADSKREASRIMYDAVALCEAAEDGGDLLVVDYISNYFQNVVVPAIRAYDHYKRKDYTSALASLVAMEAADWRLVMFQWIQRRQDKAAAKEQA